jgi:UDP-perosamine 4-acetyltransferase
VTSLVVTGLVVIGAGGHAKVVIELLRAAGLGIAGLIDPAPPGPEVLGVPVLGGDAALPGLRAAGLSAAVIALGDNALRQRVGTRLAALGFDLPAVIHPAALVSPSTRIAAGVVVMAGAAIGPDAELGPLAIVNTRAVVEHDNRIAAAAHIAPGAVLAGRVTVGERALVGAGAAVRPGIAIGADAVIGVGAAVVADIAAAAVVAGVPARPLARGLAL